ncbi:MAG: [FeFe] hydrogenase H-cluster maturation GTPase HydF [Duodenibacillus sp.]|nr:[FeFe] hydrogenase H-cluster maturation GTPase HydF [Duodenibacillus sp.]
MSNAPRIGSRLDAPKGLRLYIGLFGRRNAGKSSLINALTNQNLSIVSDVAGTTTDAVEKACELAPIGPVVFIDTAGVDDVGALGQLRVERTLSLLAWMDVALIVCDAKGLTEEDTELLADARSRKIPVVAVINKADTVEAERLEATASQIRALGLSPVVTSASQKRGLDELREAITELVQKEASPDLPLMGDLVKPGDTVLLVTPIDTGAPKGRLILPQVQAIREILDADAKCIVVRENHVREAIEEMKTPPAFVVTDSQAVLNVCEQTPESIPVTTFSIQMAFSKSDLVEMARGAAMLEFLRPGDKVMVCETCSHHPQPDDIGRKKIPRWLAKKVGGELDVDVVVGKDFPADLTPYRVILQCGGCVVTRRHMLSRVAAAVAQGVPMTNYGVAISYLQGVLPRALQLHPEAFEAYRQARELLARKNP